MTDEELIADITEQLAAARRDAEEAEAYAAELEAKLEKAVDVINESLIAWDDHNKHGYNMEGDWVSDARTTLVELTGGKDE